MYNNSALFVQYTCQSKKQNGLCQKRRLFIIIQMAYCVYQIIIFNNLQIMKPGGNINPQQSMNKLKQLCSQTEKFDKKIVGKDFLMGKYFDAQKSKPISKKQKKYAKSKIEKLLNIQQKLTGKERTYNFYLPLHQLWKSYTTDLLKNDKNQDSVCLKLLRADYHGAQITIIQSTINSYIGLTEFKNIQNYQSRQSHTNFTKELNRFPSENNRKIFQRQWQLPHLSINRSCQAQIQEQTSLKIELKIHGNTLQ